MCRCVAAVVTIYRLRPAEFEFVIACSLLDSRYAVVMFTPGRL